MGYNTLTMKQKPIKGIEKYSDKWVALDESKKTIIAGGKNLNEVLKEASKKVDKPVLMRVPPLDVVFSP